MLSYISELKEDDAADLLTLKGNLLQNLHPIIRKRLQKSGLGFNINTYVGYDTEYELEKESKYKNKALSMQLVLNVRSVIKVPIYPEFKIGTIHALTGEEYRSKDSEENLISWLENSIK